MTFYLGFPEKNFRNNLKGNLRDRIRKYEEKGEKTEYIFSSDSERRFEGESKKLRKSHSKTTWIKNCEFSNCLKYH